MKLHIQRNETKPGAMCGAQDDSEYMMRAEFYLGGNKATKYNTGGSRYPFTGWCEECITSSDMAFYMLAELA